MRVVNQHPEAIRFINTQDFALKTGQGDKQIVIPKISVAIIAIVVTGILLTAVTSAVLTSNQKKLSTSGTITTVQTVNIGVYIDVACEQTCGSISWSAIPPGNSTSRIVYIKNTGTKSVTLSLSTTNWSANANGPITLSWNIAAGTTLASNQSINATLTLSASSSISGITNFGFDIIITGTEV